MQAEGQENHHGVRVMKRCLQALVKGVAVVLVCLLPGSSAAYAKPVNPESIHRKIVQRGIGNWVCVEESNGVLLVGRITNVDEQSFGLQLDNYPTSVTTVPYAEVVKLRNYGHSSKGFLLWTAAGLGGVVAFAIIAHHQMTDFKNNEPTLPPMPGYPGVK